MEDLVKIEKLKRVSKDGTEKEYDVISTFDYKDRKFVLYTDYSNDEEKNIKIYSGIIEKNGRVSPIANDEDEIVATNFIKFLEKSLKNNTLPD